MVEHEFSICHPTITLVSNIVMISSPVWKTAPLLLVLTSALSGTISHYALHIVQVLTRNLLHVLIANLCCGIEQPE